MDRPLDSVRVVRDWLRNGTAKSGVLMPGVANDYTTAIASWQQANAW